jgi:hypothetical protein
VMKGADEELKASQLPPAKEVVNCTKVEDIPVSKSGLCIHCMAYHSAVYCIHCILYYLSPSLSISLARASSLSLSISLSLSLSLSL